MRKVGLNLGEGVKVACIKKNKVIHMYLPMLPNEEAIAKSIHINPRLSNYLF
jgi:hypothetical protein